MANVCCQDNNVTHNRPINNNTCKQAARTRQIIVFYDEMQLDR